jgi:hypothetical protein
MRPVERDPMKTCGRFDAGRMRGLPCAPAPVRDLRRQLPYGGSSSAMNYGRGPLLRAADLHRCTDARDPSRIRHFPPHFPGAMRSSRAACAICKSNAYKEIGRDLRVLSRLRNSMAVTRESCHGFSLMLFTMTWTLRAVHRKPRAMHRKPRAMPWADLLCPFRARIQIARASTNAIRRSVLSQSAHVTSGDADEVASDCGASMRGAII